MALNMVVCIEKPVPELLNDESFKDRSRENHYVLVLLISSISMHCVLQHHHLDERLNLTQLGRFYVLGPYPPQDLKKRGEGDATMCYTKFC